MEKKGKDSQYFGFFGGNKEEEYGNIEADNKGKGLFSFFGKSNNDKADIESFKQNENTPLMNTIKTGFMNKALGVKESISGTVGTGANYKYFAIFMAVGVALIFLSLLFLPVVVLSPHKFAWLFSIGSLWIFIGLGYYHGLMKFITQWDLIRLAFAASVFMTLFSSIILGSYLLCILFSIVQLFATGFFVCSYFPGGTQGMKFITTSILQGLVNCFKK